METSPLSTLPEYVATRFHIEGDPGSYDMIQTFCPRADCGLEFWVPGAWLRGSKSGYKTSPCPHCFRPSWIPGYGPEKPAPPKQPKKIIKRRPSA